MKVTKKLDDVSIEFILASKSLDAFNTVMLVYKGHYGEYSLNKSLDALVEILSPIVQVTKEVRLDKVLSDLLPVNRWKSGVVGLPVDMPLNETIVRYLISEMRRLQKDSFLDVTNLPEKTNFIDIISNELIPSMKVLTNAHFFTTEQA